MIKVESINKSIDGNVILTDCSMHVRKGSIYGLVGPNGSGKSTIIRHIVGAMRPDSGEILIDGVPVYENPSKKAEIAYVPDDIFYHLTDNISSLKRFYKDLYPSFDDNRYEQLLAAFPALDKKKMIRSFSKGMQRQVAFLLALCVHPKVLVLDEPLDGLDPVMRRQILSVVVNEVAANEISVLISSHNLRELEDICDYVGIMNKGKIVIERSLLDLQASVSKYQLAFEGDLPELPDSLEILHKISLGRVHTIIVKGEPGEAESVLKELNPVIMDSIPLTLEEIFIYEMGGAGYGTADIHLS